MVNSKNILHLVNGEFYAGAERVQDLLALNLNEFGYNVNFVCLKRGVFATERQAVEVPLRSFVMRGKFDLTVAWQIASYAREQGCSLVHAHTPRSALIANFVSRSIGLPFVYHVHGPTFHDTENRFRNYWNALIERASIARASLAIPVSSHAQDYACQVGFPKSRLRLVWNGVPIVPAVNRSACKEPFVLGSVALFRPRKGVEVLIDAFARLADSIESPCVLHMIGDFESSVYESEIKSRAVRMGVADRIKWLGYTNAVYDELRKLAVFVLPSLYGEGLPMVVLEAMAAGLPIVATRVGGIGDAIKDGENGLLVEGNDSVAMADAIQTLLTDRPFANRLAAKARQNQIDTFSDRAMARGVAAVYDEIVSDAF